MSTLSIYSRYAKTQGVLIDVHRPARSLVLLPKQLVKEIDRIRDWPGFERDDVHLAVVRVISDLDPLPVVKGIGEEMYLWQEKKKNRVTVRILRFSESQPRESASAFVQILFV